MKICPDCSFRNREGLFFCDNCGYNLAKTPSVETRKFMEARTGAIQSRVTWGTAHFTSNSQIVLHIQNTPQPIILEPVEKTVLGRQDSSTTKNPDLDLSPYGALEKGVSRIHAAILRQQDTLTLMDMGSANGTHLNGQRLTPEQPRVLRDGDEIRLGKLIAHIYFGAASFTSSI